MAGARQRLHRARARRAPVRADRRSGCGRSAPPHFGCHSDGILLLSERRRSAHVAELRIFNPDGTEAELSGNGAREAVLYLRRARLDRRRHVHDPHRRRGDHADPDRTRIGRDRDGPRVDALEGLPERSRGRPRHDRRRPGVEREFQHVSIGNPQCAIEVAEGLEEPRPAAIGPAIESARDLSEPHQRQLLECRRADTSGRGSSSAGWGRRSPPAPAPPAPPSPPICAAPAARSPCVLDGGELLVEIGGGSRGRP